MIGSRLGPYEITAKLGEGGMGEVYRATDTKLERQVAIKVLPAAFTEDKERLARFEREAKLLAQLHHPNIASIFGLEESDGTRALVMELVDGPTLAERLESGALPFNESLSVSLQIAQALEEAHEKGIVHRDLKPQNIKASIEGKVKVLDFGLAKAMDPAAAASGSGAGSASLLAQSPTLTLGATQMGVILGTAAYMAPEQAKGMAVDKRADIWAFGVVLWEMLTGRSLFAGDSVPDTLARVLQRDVDFDALPPTTPPAIRRLVRRCLERNPKNRLHDIADARIVIEDVTAGRGDEAAAASPAPIAAPPAPAPRWPLAVAALAVAFAAVALWRPWAGPGALATPARAFQLEISAPAGTTLLSGMALSPDGSQIAFVARPLAGRPQLYVRRVDSLEARPLPGTEDARYPFWAPDGRRLGFFAGSRLKVTDLIGVPRVVAPSSATSDARGATWGADDVIVYAPNFVGGLRRVAAQGGEPATMVEPPDGSRYGTYRFPFFLPDGRHFVFYASTGSGIEPGRLLLASVDDPQVTELGDSHSMAVSATGEELFYVRGDQLVVQRLDVAGRRLVGEPRPLGLRLPGGIAVASQRSLAASRDGLLLTREDKRTVSELVWVDRTGELLEELRVGDPAWWYGPRLSADGRRLSVARYGAETTNGDIWTHELDRRFSTRLTFDETDEQLGVWHPDGKTLATSSTRSARRHSIYLLSEERPGALRKWRESESFLLPDFFTRDGRRLVFEQTDERGAIDLWIGELDRPDTARKLFDDPGAKYVSALSRDGVWIVYCSDATRSLEVYVRRLDGSGTAHQVSSGGGCQPQWRADDRELYYVAENGDLMAVAVELVPEPRFGAPQLLFAPRLEDAADRQYDVSHDGQRFLLNRRTGNDTVPIVLTSGWERPAGGAPR